MNAAKKAIDQLRAAVDRKVEERSARPEVEAEIVDEEEFAFLRDLKEQKRVSIYACLLVPAWMCPQQNLMLFVVVAGDSIGVPRRV